jgi:hypothetical protein
MIDEVRTLLGQCWDLRPIGEWVEITTPFLDRHNDRLQVYARRCDDGFLLTDDGYVLTDLEQAGISLGDAELRALVGARGVQVAGKALEVRATRDTFGARLHALVQAMLLCGHS